MQPSSPIATCLLILAAIIMVAAGCGDVRPPAGDGGADKPKAPVERSIGKVPADKLPEPGEPFPPLEGGRLTLYNPPEPWKRMVRRRAYVGGWYLEKESDLPRMLLTSEPAKDDDPDRLTADNLATFALQIEKEFKEQKAALIEPPRGLMIGGSAWVRCVKPGVFRDRLRVERQILMTIANGQRYLLELTAPDTQTLVEHRDAAYSVALNMEFSSPETEAPANDAQPAR